MLEVKDKERSEVVNNLSADSNNYICPSLSSLTGSYSMVDSTFSTASSEEFDECDELGSITESRDENLFEIRDTDTDVEVVANDNILQNSVRQDGKTLNKRNKGSLKSIGKCSLKNKLPKLFSKRDTDSFADSELRRSKIDRYAVRSNRDRYSIENMEDVDAFSVNSDMLSRFSQPETKVQVRDKPESNHDSYDLDALAQWFSKNFDFDIMDKSKNLSDYFSNQNFDFGIVKVLEEAIEATASESNHLYSEFVGTLEENLVSLQSAVDSVQQSLFTLNDTIESNEATGSLEKADMNERDRDQAISKDNDPDECKEDFEIGLRQSCSSTSQDEEEERMSNPGVDNEKMQLSRSSMILKPKKVRFLISKLVYKVMKKKFLRRKNISEARDK